MIVKDKKDIKAVKQNWKTVFGDGDDFLDKLFSLKPIVFAFKAEEKIASSLIVIEMHYKNKKTGYIYGAMTLPEYRSQGLMKKLLDEVCETLSGCGFSAVFLLPANEALYGYYENCGFIKNLPVDTGILSDIPDGIKDKVPCKTEYECLEYPVKRGYDFFEFAVKLHLANGGHTLCKDDDFIAYHISDGQVIADMACTKNLKRDRFAMSKCFDGFVWDDDAHIGLLME